MVALSQSTINAVTEFLQQSGFTQQMIDINLATLASREEIAPAPAIEPPETVTFQGPTGGTTLEQEIEKILDQIEGSTLKGEENIRRALINAFNVTGISSNSTVIDSEMAAIRLWMERFQTDPVVPPITLETELNKPFIRTPEVKVETGAGRDSAAEAQFARDAFQRGQLGSFFDRRDAFQEQFSAISGQRPQPVSSLLRGFLGSSAGAASLLAPFLQPGSAFSPGEAGIPIQQQFPTLGSVPQPGAINEALMRALGGGPTVPFANFSPLQQGLSNELLNPQANQQVFNLATQPTLSQLGPYMQRVMRNFLQTEFDVWNQAQGEQSFGGAFAGGTAPSGFNFLPQISGLVG